MGTRDHKAADSGAVSAGDKMRCFLSFLIRAVADQMSGYLKIGTKSSIICSWSTLLLSASFSASYTTTVVGYAEQFLWK